MRSTFEVVEVYRIDCLHAVFLDVLNDLHEEDVLDDLNRLLLRPACAWFCLGCVYRRHLRFDISSDSSDDAETR